MNAAEFAAADLTGTNCVTITIDNNPYPYLTLGGGRVNKLLTAPNGKLYIYDGDTAVYLKLDRQVGLTKYYSVVAITQDPTAFSTLVNS